MRLISEQKSAILYFFPKIDIFNHFFCRNPNRPFNVQNLFGRPTGDSFIYWEPFDSKVQQFLRIGKTDEIIFQISI